MSDLLAQVLLTAFVLAVPATASLFVGAPRRPRWGAASRAALVVLTAALATFVVGLAIGAGSGSTIATAAIVALVIAANAGAATPWTARGLAVWSLTLLAGAAYLAYVATWLVTTSRSPVVIVGGGALWILELFVYVLAIGYVWELVDVTARWDWRRTRAVAEVVEGEEPATTGPFVSLHVPTHDEPPDMVIETLQSLLELHYDDYEVLLLDNNTDDEALWRPVEAFCAQHDRLRFFHLSDWPGYKSGALNFGLEQCDPRTEVVGVIDADYQVAPDFLSRCTPLFADGQLAFVQSPQDYRDWETDRYFRRLYYSYSYFFEVSQRSRNERDGAIFGGTMGLIRREALVGVGGWDEWCITEDAELSLRLLRAGWSGMHVPESFGRGIMPLTFEALKRQRFRWCFGGVQILRMHWRSLLPWGRTDNHLTLSQRWAYLVGALQWFGDLTGLVFTTFLLFGAVNVAIGSGTALRQLTAPLLVCVVGLVLLGSLRSVGLLHRVSGATWRDAFGAFFLWLGLAWCVAFASVRGLVAREGAFLRTPKVRGDVGWRDALRGNIVECVLALGCLAGAGAAVAGAVAGRWGGAGVAALLLVQGTGYAAAPVNSFAALNADLTPELRRRRRDKRLSWTRRAGVRRLGVGPVLAGVVAAGLLVALAAPVGAPSFQRLREQAVPRTALHPQPGARLSQRPVPAAPEVTPSSGTTPAPSLTPVRDAVQSTAAQPTSTASTAVATRSASPSGAAVTPSSTPTFHPTSSPTSSPTARPSARPTTSATSRPSGRPTTQPSHKPTAPPGGGKP